MDDTFLTVSKRIKQRTFIQILTRECENRIGIHRRLLPVYCEDNVDIRTVRRWVMKWRDMMEVRNSTTNRSLEELSA